MQTVVHMFCDGHRGVLTGRGCEESECAPLPSLPIRAFRATAQAIGRIKPKLVVAATLRLRRLAVGAVLQVFIPV